jgi:hypothetical protein
LQRQLKHQTGWPCLQEGADLHSRLVELQAIAAVLVGHGYWPAVGHPAHQAFSALAVGAEPSSRVGRRVGQPIKLTN